LTVSDCVVHDLSSRLIDIVVAVSQDKDIDLHLNTEGPCLESLTYRSHSKLIPLLNTICEKYKYDPKRIRIVTGNLIETACWPNIDKRLTISGWFHGKHVKAIQQPKKFKHHFGNFVSNSTWPRLLLSSHLHKYGDKTFQTYRRDPRDPGQAVDLDLDQLMFNCTDPSVLKDITTFIQALPIEKEKALAEHPKTNLDAGEDGDAVNTTIMSWYGNFFCDVVTETFFTGNTFFPTEKTMRPLVCGNPFIVHGPVDFLHNLRRLDFITFSHFWNEDYDKWTGYERYKRMLPIIEKLASMSLDELDQMYKDMLPILQHNQEVIERLENRHFDIFFQ